MALNAESAFPYAWAVTHVGDNNLFDVLHAHAYAVSPLTVPLVLPPLPNEAPRDYRLRLGYKPPLEGDELEGDESFLSRLGGVVRFLAALYCAPSDQSHQNFPQLSRAWTWVSRALNLPPHPLLAHLLLAFLEVAAPYLQRRFPRQVHKLFLAVRDYLPRLPREAEAPRTRLELLLGRALQSLLDFPKGTQLPEDTTNYATQQDNQ